MSNPSGIKVSNKVTEAWADACKAGADNVRALVLQITGGKSSEQLTHRHIPTQKVHVRLFRSQGHGGSYEIL